MSVTMILKGLIRLTARMGQKTEFLSPAEISVFQNWFSFESEIQPKIFMFPHEQKFASKSLKCFILIALSSCDINSVVNTF